MVDFNPTNQNLIRLSAYNNINQLNQPRLAPYSINNGNVKDELIISSVNKPKEKEITFGEGVKLVAQGFISKAGEMVKSVIKHPVKTLGTIALTSAALAALPLIGVSVATGTAALAVGFAGIAAFGMAKDIIKTIKANSNGQYDAMRNDLKNIGGDGFDLALSLPFVPKAINQIKRQMKFAPQLAGNSELWANIKNAKSIKAKFLEFNKGNLKLEYQTQVKELGMKTAPELLFEENLPGGIVGLYNPTTCQLKMSTYWLNPINRLKMKATSQKAAGSNLSPEGFLRHELEHVKQFSTIVRTENVGITGLTDALKSYHAERMPGLEQDAMQLKENIAAFKDPVAHKKDYAERIDKWVEEEIENINKSNLSEFEKSTERANVEEMGEKSKLNQDVELEKIKKIPKKQVDAQIKEMTKTLNYAENELKLSKNVLENPETAINTDFYRQIVKEQGIIKAGSEEATNGQRYLSSFADKIKDGEKIAELRMQLQNGNIELPEYDAKFIELYKSNSLETEAYNVQEKYINTALKNRPGVPAALVVADSTISDKPGQKIN